MSTFVDFVSLDTNCFLKIPHFWNIHTGRVFDLGLLQTVELLGERGHSLHEVGENLADVGGVGLLVSTTCASSALGSLPGVVSSRRGTSEIFDGFIEKI